MSSRLIIKNLPKNITENKLRQIFEEKGSITDIQLKYTKDGVFRQFAFLGYQNEDDANAALKYFNNSFIQTTRIKVEPCTDLGSEKKPKSWSKHATDSTTYRKIHGIDEFERSEKIKQLLESKSKKKKKIDEIIGDHKDDPEFQEFMEVHGKNRNMWANDCDTLIEGKSEKAQNLNESSEKISTKIESNTETLENRSDSEDGNEENSERGYDESEINGEKEAKEFKLESDVKLALKNDVDDLEYMKSLMKIGGPEKNSDKEKIKKKVKESVDFFTIKIHNVPFKTKKQDILKFFKPLKPNSVRIPGSTKGFCYVGFKQEKDFQKALLKDKSFIKGKQVFLSNFTEKNKITKLKKGVDGTKDVDKTGKWHHQKEKLQNEEDISESGKIFYRNLAYTVCEDNIQNLFEKFGPIAEISLPIDPITRKIKGFGTVTFVMPEHAMLAFNELDGSTFHGRLLHLIPGKAKDSAEQDENMEGLSFKEKKALQLKKSAGQSHNWNTLFMGSNVVADILAKKFDTSKEIILDANAGGSSAAVRLALGETQIVMEMKKFLDDNNVQLDVFDTVPKKRSKTIILAKNLPSDTTIEELTPLFSKFGVLGRVVLPPSGITALIEFFDPSEAKKAFYKLAYSKFKHLPLYLEWAPENTFSDSIKDSENTIRESKDMEKVKIKENINEDEKNSKILDTGDWKKDESKQINVNYDEADEDEEPEMGTTLFLRNLNFSTVEETVTNHFKHLGRIHLVQVARRKDPMNPKKVCSLGYGFIQFKNKVTTETALKEMQMTKIDGNIVELKRSDRTLRTDVKRSKPKVPQTTQTGTKLLIRNIPFQAKTKEIFEIFKAFGELRSVRLPKKLTPGEQSIRGFGFVDYLSKSDAKTAFENLSGSTHLYGRRLVLEWAKVDDENDVTELRKRTAETFKDVGGKKTRGSKKAIFDTTQIKENDDQNDEYEMN